MDKLDKTKLAALAAALVGAFAVGAVVVDDDGGGKDTRATITLDAKAYHEQMKTYRDQTPGAVDLLSEPVEPGAATITGVSLQLGKRATDVQPTGAFRVDSTTYRDDADARVTWMEVRATNTGATIERFVAVAQVAP